MQMSITHRHPPILRKSCHGRLKVCHKQKPNRTVHTCPVSRESGIVVEMNNMYSYEGDEDINGFLVRNQRSFMIHALLLVFFFYSLVSSDNLVGGSIVVMYPPPPPCS